MSITPMDAKAGVDLPPKIGHPAIGLGGTRSLDEMIVREVRRLIRERPDPGSTISSLPGFGDGADPADEMVDEDAMSMPSLGDAVIAAHATRIAYLERRMDTLRSEGAAIDRLQELRGRLRRAQAARQLAVDRVALADADTLRSYGVLSHDGALLRSPAPPVVAVHSHMETTPMEKAAERSGRRLAEATRHDTDGVHAASGTGRSRSPLIAIANRSSAHRLAYARRSLATARHLLAGETDGTSPAIAIAIAGLWQWEGSDRWSLSDYRAEAV